MRAERKPLPISDLGDLTDAGAGRFVAMRYVFPWVERAYSAPGSAVHVFQGAQQMSWSFEDRQRFLAGVDRADQSITRFYGWLIKVLLVGMLAGIAYVFWSKPFGAGAQGEWFYFSMFALLGLGWAISQLVWVRRRQRTRWSVKDESRPGEGNFKFSISRTVETPMAMLAGDVLPQEEALGRLEYELARGADLDEACRRVQPAYSDLSELERQAFRLYVTCMLQKRGTEVPQ
jgi:hypothetical protein